MAASGRAERVCLAGVVASCVALSWLAMQAVHEGGHVLHAWLSGGSIARVVVHPLEISRTELGRNPHPLFVAAGGLLWGGALPAAGLRVASRLDARAGQLVRFFAGFCLIANGTYLLAGTLARTGDPADLLRHRAPAALLLLLGAAMAGAGLAVWHRLGPRMGFGVHAGPAACRTAAVLALLLALFAFSATQNGE
jgi:hypothetical protein